MVFLIDYNVVTIKKLYNLEGIDLKILNEVESSPKIANFWYIDSEFVGPSCDVREGETTGGRYITCGYNHFDSWSEFGGKNAEKYTFEHFPRGRVGFDDMTRSFYVIGNSDMIKDRTFQQRVIQKYNLPGKVTFLTDVHYDLP